MNGLYVNVIYVIYVLLTGTPYCLWQLGAMVTKLQEYGMSKSRVSLVHGLLRFCGSDK
jgi:hypothetical protein